MTLASYHQSFLQEYNDEVPNDLDKTSLFFLGRRLQVQVLQQKEQTSIQPFILWYEYSIQVYKKRFLYFEWNPATEDDVEPWLNGWLAAVGCLYETLCKEKIINLLLNYWFLWIAASYSRLYSIICLYPTFTLTDQGEEGGGHFLYSGIVNKFIN